ERLSIYYGFFIFTKRSVLENSFFFFSSRRRHTRYIGDWSSDVCSSDLELVHMMVGREIKELEPRRRDAGETRLRIEGLRTQGDQGEEALRGIDLEIRSGEIVGLAGVSGNGQRELAECLAGMRPATAGKVSLKGRELGGATLNER